MTISDFDESTRVSLKMLRARLQALFETLSSMSDSSCGKGFYEDAVSISAQLGKLLNKEMFSFQDMRNYTSDSYYRVEVLSRVRQLIAIFNVVLEEPAAAQLNFLEMARDVELRKRCGDLLSTSGPYDRAINQATQVFEDRLRSYANLAGETGHTVVSKAINSDPQNSIVRISDDKEIQTGYAEICRGLIRAFRNPTHHAVRDDYTRAEAEAVCIFIDHLLDVIKRSVVK